MMSTVPSPAAFGLVRLSFSRRLVDAPSSSAMMFSMPKAARVAQRRSRMKRLSSTTMTVRRSQPGWRMSSPRTSGCLPLPRSIAANAAKGNPPIVAGSFGFRHAGGLERLGLAPRQRIHVEAADQLVEEAVPVDLGLEMQEDGAEAEIGRAHV